MEEHIIEKMGVDYLTLDDLLRLAKDVPVGDLPTYHGCGGFSSFVESHVDLNVDAE